VWKHTVKINPRNSKHRLTVNMIVFLWPWNHILAFSESFWCILWRCALRTTRLWPPLWSVASKTYQWRTSGWRSGAITFSRGSTSSE